MFDSQKLMEFGFSPEFHKNISLNSLIAKTTVFSRWFFYIGNFLPLNGKKLPFLLKK